MSKTKIKWNEIELDCLTMLRGGCDVGCYTLAGIYRDIQQKDDTLIDFTKPMCREYRVEEKLPYFGAILTAKGAELVKGRKKRDVSFEELMAFKFPEEK